ncbi:MAG TPA: EF-hand domain-containing protein [Bdellovibrionota bacterium]|jgi:hypothetical protein
MNRGNKLNKLIATVALLAPLGMNAYADGTPLMVNPEANSRPGAPATGNVSRSGSDGLQVRIVTSCYAVNLRHTPNPLSNTSLVKMSFDVIQGDKVHKGVFVTFPGDIVTKAGMADGEPDKAVDKSFFGGIEGMGVAMYGNVIQMNLPILETANTVFGDGSIKKEAAANLPKLRIVNMRFYQTAQNCNNQKAIYGSAGYSTHQATYKCGQYMGHTGDLTAVAKAPNIAADNSSAELRVSFPGETGFCGGYFSPLMLFFNKDRPKFTGSGELKLSSGRDTYWVEENAPGYFLAMDRNGNGKIDGKEELFGDQDSNLTGFDPLKELDSNKDGVLDAKDAEFGKLLLWQDKDGDGESDDGELEALDKRVVKISLRYKAKLITYGQGAEARQVSEFWYKDGGKTKKSAIEDIWFAPVAPKK